VRKILAHVITRVAGTTGVPDGGGDGGPATEAELNMPGDVAVTADGGFLIADTANHVVREVSPEGVITLAAGDYIHVDILNQALAMAVTADGEFLIADTGNNQVWKALAGVNLRQVAGTRAVGSGGDDGPAIDAELNSPHGVAATADGGFLIADTGNHVVRKVSAQGVITRVAGTTGVAGSGGDDGPPTAAELNQPTAIAVTADGGFLIADRGNHLVRRVVLVD
jgi:hypothetical protein